MDSQVHNPTKIATKWALINLLAQIIITYAIQFLNLDMNSPVKYVAYIPMVACLFLAQKEYRDVELGGYITFNQAFSAGFRYSLFSGILLAFFLYVYLAFLSPEVLTKSLETQQTAMADKGMTSEQIEKAMSIGKKYGPVFGSFFIAVWYAILGSILGLIGASILKKERPIVDGEGLSEVISE